MMHAMSRSILIVDDDPHIRELLDFALTKAGYETRQAEDGVAALEAAQARMPDLVVLDINMPRLDGLEVCRRSCSCRRAMTRSTGCWASSWAPTTMWSNRSARGR
jgi:DNA-binding response OmpR family regulator